ncbi:agmatinase [Staphylothermus hellenicus]|uniref:Agmatinase n=1 Tax=Staphylothermus hellenicus (strain DSM 12710 / JCM 10830 / BK20S6-10-b1 / P8) TaxID=591019 RepID=D7D9H8_STAHD|nr:agmatinase [Staphylothermus hellenicus]ADI32424.1 agmatinase [Staphylothermus hellenicus DSM 12710]
MTTWKHLLEETCAFACVRDENSKYIVVGIPLDSTTTYKPGTRMAPNKIREVSCNIEYYSLLENLSLERIGFNDLGNIVMAPGFLRENIDRIKNVVRGIREEYPSKTYVFLGGEHLITYPIIHELANTIDTLIIFDAHLDLRDDYLGSKLNHATHLRRILEETDIPIIHFGARAISEEELGFVQKQSNITLFSPLNLDDYQQIIDDNLGNIYISIDIDAIDPAYAPGTSNPEALGLHPIDLLRIIRNIARNARQVIGFDIVEVNPLVDINDITSILASKIVFEIIGMIEKKDLL